MQGKVGKLMREASRKPAVASLAVAATADCVAMGFEVRTTLDLETLLARARDGEEWAFGELVSRFERMVHGLVYRQTRDQALSEDLAQDVFMQLWKVLPAFTSGAALGSWLKKVSINAVISHWRQEESQRRRLEAMQEAFPPREGAETVMAQLIEDERRDQVREALETLPADLRSLLTLRLYEEMSYEELAESLGLEVGTVRSRLFRARQMVKEVLERWRQHEPSPDSRPRSADI